MVVRIDGKKLKNIIMIERGLTLKAASRGCGFHEDYLYKAIRKNYISLTAVNVLSNKYEINPVKYVIGWKGG
ncbi:MAG: hypothetical protein J6V44_08755 [Methanobrevibacter sp.]|nr:hypothetical protein [Methanobrevibacter sp.]